MAKGSAVFLCRCGGNVSDHLDLEALEVWVRQQEGVESVGIHDYLCAPTGKEFVSQTLREGAAAQAVVAACSPRLHQKTFEDCVSEAGINGGRVCMANVREHCAWVTPDPQQALEKAKQLVKAALRRVPLNVDLVRPRMEVRTDVVVIGGGIAGIEAALQAAEAGRQVTLVEKEISLGGEMIKVEELAPLGECSPCLLAPRLSEVREHPSITVVSGATVTDILGFSGNFTVVARRKARYVTDACIGCEGCFEPCPVSVTSPFHLGMGERKAIFTLFPGSEPLAAAIDDQACLHLSGQECNACVENCPFEAIDFTQQDEILEIPCGAVVLAIGAEVHVPSDIARLGWDGRRNVLTHAEMERLAASNGPTGKALRTRDGREPATVAILHCAGSLCEGGLDYCSGVCCVNALGVAETVHHLLPQANVWNIHDRLVLPGAASENLRTKVQSQGATLVRCAHLDQVRIEDLPDGRLVVRLPDGLDDLEVDLVVLATGLKPGAATRAFATRLNLDLDVDGFFKSDHAVLNKTGSVVEGIHVAGSCVRPAHAPESIVMAQAAVGRILSRLVPGRTVELEALVSRIDPNRCSGCRLCVSSCPYKAIGWNAQDRVSVVNEALCRGCGTCASTCPSGAIESVQFTDAQILEEVKGVLHA